MLIPVTSDSLPVRLEILVENAKNLPVMNKSNNSCDAFVEVRFLETVEKTDVVTSLNPAWTNEPFVFDTDEKEISEEWLQFRVMDYDTYSANDAIGRVNVDCNILLERMRNTGIDTLEETLTMKVYDTIHGLRGDLTFQIKLQLLMIYNPLNYVQIYAGPNIPKDKKVCELIGLVDNIRCEKDPDYEWLDKIRTPRRTNDARQSAIRSTLRDAIIGLAQKTAKLGGNVILGFSEFVDMEGSTSDLLTCRVFGTAVKLIDKNVNILPYSGLVKPVLTIDKVPEDRQLAMGSLVLARAVHFLDEDENPETVRSAYWNALRAELYQQAKTVGCNLVIGYKESMTVNEGVALLTCVGTAVLFSDGTETPTIQVIFNNGSSRNSPVILKDEREKEKEVKEKKPLFKFAIGEGREKRSDSTPRSFRCMQYHSPEDENMFVQATKIIPCAYCKQGHVPEFMLSTQFCPPPQYYIGPRNFVQVSVCKKIPSDPNEVTDYANDIANALPYSDHELLGNLMNEAKTVNSSGNAIFALEVTCAICDDSLVCTMTGVLIRLNVISKSDTSSPSISNVLSFSSLQRQSDARRFSWGTVRDAIKFKSSGVFQSNLTLKVLNLKQDDNSSGGKTRLRLNTIVDKVRRKQHREYVTHVVFERHLSLSIGVHEFGTAGNVSSIAGVHLSGILSPNFINRDFVDNNVATARFSDVFVREDLSTAVKDSTTVDGFVTNALEERIASIKCFMGLGGSNCQVSNMRLTCPQFNVSKEHAHIIMIVSTDLFNLT
ncbi:unnamed protein product [Caenorhabditis angaria]|uniref:C2 domain-containing protein n=1 Tax=Caenorhabditis angaria TaxID=860376 RepID=A0A9P1J300_9PELO|nr:unnamed protein product [Caenorhabditis angaria]